MKSRKYLVLGIIFLLGAIAFLLWFFKPWTWKFSNAPGELPESSSTYKSPLDWRTLKGENSDIIAWLEIPVSDAEIAAGHTETHTDSVTGKGKAFISYPILRHPTDDTYYLTHNEKGITDYEGALFTEATYNKIDFSDPCTVVYGHHMHDSDRLFACNERQYTSSDGFQAARDVIIYLPNKEIHYKVWAGVPHYKIHLLEAYNFSLEENYNLFVNKIKSIRKIGTQIDQNMALNSTSKLLILSTCLRLDPNNYRFLVLATELETVE